MGNSQAQIATTSPNATPVHDSQGFAPQTAPEALTDQGFVPQVAQELVAFPCLDTQNDGNRSYASPSIFGSSGLSPPDVEHFGNMQGVSKDGRRGVFEVPSPPKKKTQRVSCPPLRLSKPPSWGNWKARWMPRLGQRKGEVLTPPHLMNLSEESTSSGRSPIRICNWH